MRTPTSTATEIIGPTRYRTPEFAMVELSARVDFPDPALGDRSDPRTFRAAAVTNAFYFVNLAHDFFYRLGFDERSGNFQTDNGDKGGRGGDPVMVEV